MSFDELRLTTAEIDEAHREAMRDIHERLAEAHLGDEPALAASRRSFLARVAAGGAIAFGATAIPVTALAGAAAAQTGGSSGSTPGTAKGTANPALEADLTVATFARTVELAAVRLYESAIATGELAPPVVETARTFGRHHAEHAAALATVAGATDAGVANPAVLNQFSPQITAAADQAAVLQVLYSLEEGAAATYQFAMGTLLTPEAAGAAARILPVEGQHAVALSRIITPDVGDWAASIGTYVPAFQTDSGALSPDRYATR